MTTAVPSPLITPLCVGSMQLLHRVTMSAMTRLRMEPGTERPRELNELYYEQRASKGGLLVTEGIQPDSVTSRGYVRAPVMERQDQVDAWAKVVQRVHAKGGYIFAQLMHTGRASHDSLNSSGHILAPSAVRMHRKLYIEGWKKEDASMPKAMTKEDMEQVKQSFVRAAKMAVQGAGFDGVEVHSASGYLLQQFLSRKTNQRTDEYGGGPEGRAKFVLEVVDALAAELGRERVSIKISPGCTPNDLIETEGEVLEMLAYLLPQLDARGLAYVDIMNANVEPYFRWFGFDKPYLSFDLHREARKHYKGVLMANGGLTVEMAEEYVKDGTADLVSFATTFLSTPNLPAAVAAGKRNKDLNLAGANPAIWYSKSPEDDGNNYTDFPDVPV